MTSDDLINPTDARRLEQLTVKTYANRTDLGQAAGMAAAAQLQRLLALQQRVNIVFAAFGGV